MPEKRSYNILNIAAIFLAAMFFSCSNDIKEVEDFLAEKNLPIGIAKNVNLIHTDSGKIKTNLISPLMHDFSNRKNHPYSEFPNGIKLISYDSNGDSVILTADYSISFNKTSISEIKNNVLVSNPSKRIKLSTSQLFWDSKEHYIYTEQEFTLITASDTIHGKGFESNEDLSKVNMKSIRGTIYVDDN